MTSGQDKSSRSTTRSSAGGNGRKKPRPRRPTITPPRRSFRGDLIERFAEGWFTWGLLLAVGFLLVSSSLAVWTRAQPLIAVERVMTETRLVRVEFQSVNEEQTRARRENARQATPRVYDANEDRVRSLATAVRTLPRRAAEAGTLDQVPSEVRRRFGLNAARFEALSRIGADPEALESWDESVSELLTVLRRTPLLTAQAYRAASIEGRDRRLELVRDGESELVPRAQAVNIEDAGQLESTLQRVVEIAGFQGPPAQTVLSGLTSDPQPTYSLDESLTAERQRAAAEQVLPVVDTRSVGQVIFSRGDVLTPSQFETYAAELREFRAWAASNAPWRLWMPRIAVGGAISGLIALLVLTLLTIDPGLIRQTRRLAGAAALVLGAQIIAALIAVLEQRFAYVGALLPVLLAASVLTIVHGRALAIPMGIAAAVVVGLTIELSAGLLLVMVLAVVGAAFGLGDIRDRRVVVRTGVACGVLVAITTPTIGMIGRPATPDALAQAMGDATLAGLAALIAQAITLFALPNVERLFGVTTGLALIELRDPKQRLLRDLQQRAPGTYNHSLNVASIAESAANAIGADALLTYVGALFHDIGKMNKPEYFVENQSGGASKHDTLSPAMSLLVIVGHVKDGVEIARAYGLPRNLHHFIEAHHGTTLVEYFYHRAVQQAEREDSNGDGDLEDERMPQDIQYRYPGPRPRTKECAILMLSDAVESATRSISEPTPRRIDTLVRDLASKRLADGQFDDCDLTFRELQIISESIAKSVTGIYHGRIQYPGQEPKRREAAASGEAGSGPAEKTA